QLSGPDLPFTRTPAAATRNRGAAARQSLGRRVNDTHFNPDLWKPALDKYAEVTGLSVELFGIDGQLILTTLHRTPLVELFRKYGFETGLFAECAHRCLQQTADRPAV